VTRYPYEVPGWGVGEIWVRDGVVIQHVLASEEVRAGGSDSRPSQASLASPSTGIVSELCRRIDAHLAGERTTYDGVVVDLDWATPLQRELAAAARAIPWGDVVTYGELAALAGRPGAARAAGSFCADNRYSLIIPCHRVVAANGIGGYGAAGPALKRRLLALESVHL
jgi:methylated-DNA-[protein]-cysteine S-methyltransferase